jgi:O-antigen ligase
LARPRLEGYALALLLVAAALPVRFPVPALDRSISVFDIAVGALSVLWLVLVRRHGWPRIPGPYLVLGGLLLGLGAVSLAWTIDRGDTLVHVVASAESLLVFGYAVTFLRLAGDRTWHRWAQFFLVLLVAPGLLLWLGVPGFGPPVEVDPRSGDYWSYFVRLSHPFIGRSNNLAALLVLLVVPLSSWALRTRRRLDVGAALLAGVALVLTLSRGALLSLGLVLVVFLAGDRRLRRPVIRALRWLLPVVGVAALVAAANPLTRELVVARLSAANVQARLDLLALFRDEFGPRWLLGAGAGTGVDVHNTYAQQLLSFGLIGGTAVIIAIVLTGVWWFRRHPHTRPVLTRIVGLGVATALLSFAVESSFEGTLLRPLVWLVWGMLATLVTRTSQRTLSPPGYRHPGSSPG